jgi:hypothetical protein
MELVVLAALVILCKIGLLLYKHTPWIKWYAQTLISGGPYPLVSHRFYVHGMYLAKTDIVVSIRTEQWGEIEVDTGDFKDHYWYMDLLKQILTREGYAVIEATNENIPDMYVMFH